MPSRASSERRQKEQHVLPTPRDFVNRDCSCNFSLSSIEIILAQREKENPLSSSRYKFGRQTKQTTTWHPRPLARCRASRCRLHVQGTPEDWTVTIDLCLAAVAVDATRDSRGYMSRFFGTPPVNDLLSAASPRVTRKVVLLNSPFFHTGCGWISTRINVESLYLRRYGRGLQNSKLFARKAEWNSRRMETVMKLNVSELNVMNFHILTKNTFYSNT